MDITEEVTVTYTVRDLLAEIRDDVKEVKHDMSNKVDKAEFVKLEGRVENIEKSLWQSKGFIGACVAIAGGAGFGLERLFG